MVISHYLTMFYVMLRHARFFPNAFLIMAVEYSSMVASWGLYSFYDKYTGPGDKAVCGNTTRRSTNFQAAAKKVVWSAVQAAPNNEGYAREEVSVAGTANDSAYVLLIVGGVWTQGLVELVLRMHLLQYWGACPGQKGEHWTLDASWGTQTEIFLTRNRKKEVQKVNKLHFYSSL